MQRQEKLQNWKKLKKMAKMCILGSQFCTLCTENRYVDLTDPKTLLVNVIRHHLWPNYQVWSRYTYKQPRNYKNSLLYLNKMTKMRILGSQFCTLCTENRYLDQTDPKTLLATVTRHHLWPNYQVWSRYTYKQPRNYKNSLLHLRRNGPNRATHLPNSEPNFRTRMIHEA